MQIYLVASTSMTGEMDRFLQANNLTWQREDPASDAERVAEAAGRVCYLSFGARQYRQSNSTYLSNILKQGHDSVLEHANFTIVADGITRALSHQLVRHRAGFAYSQLSQQYHDESQAEFIEPDGLNTDPVLREKWENWKNATLDMYQTLLSAPEENGSVVGMLPKEKLRFARSAARSVLPNATKTILVVTGNARAWRNVFVSRGNIAGDVEMREYCVSAYRVLYKAAPNLFSGFDLLQDEFGSHLVKSPHEAV